MRHKAKCALHHGFATQRRRVVSVQVDPITQALRTDLTIDLTTVGRRSGKPRRIEIWLLSVDDRLILTGTPGRRDWFANLLANPSCTVHLKQAIRADLAATAQLVSDPDLRRHILEHRDAAWYRQQGDDFAALLAEAPMVELTIELGQSG